MLAVRPASVSRRTDHAGPYRGVAGQGIRLALQHECRTIPRTRLHLPGPDFLERVHSGSDRGPRVKRNLAAIFNHGRLSGSGYLSILSVDQGVA